MEERILAQKLREQRPSIYLRPEIQDVRALQFYRAEEVYRQSAAITIELKQKLASLVVL